MSNTITSNISVFSDGYLADGTPMTERVLLMGESKLKKCRILARPTIRTFLAVLTPEQEIMTADGTAHPRDQVEAYSELAEIDPQAERILGQDLGKFCGVYVHDTKNQEPGIIPTTWGTGPSGRLAFRKERGGMLIDAITLLSQRGEPVTQPHSGWVLEDEAGSVLVRLPYQALGLDNWEPLDQIRTVLDGQRKVYLNRVLTGVTDPFQPHTVFIPVYKGQSFPAALNAFTGAVPQAETPAHQIRGISHYARGSVKEPVRV